MPCLRIGLADAQAKSEFSVEPGVRKEEIAAAVEAVHDGLIRFVSALMSKADEVQRHWCGKFKVFALPHPLRELLRQVYMLAYVVL